MLKKSKYLISVKVNKNQSLIYSTLSGKVLFIQDKVLRLIMDSKFHEMNQDLLDKLKEYGFLVPKRLNETGFVLSTNKQQIENSKTLYYPLMPTGLCQLGCVYCGQKHLNISFSNHIKRRILEKIETALLSSRFTRLAIGWFGGEPTLAIGTMREMTSELKKICSKHSVSFSGGGMPSNGVNLTLELFKQLEQLEITSIDITLDGLARTHDRSRFTKGKKKTFDKIVSNLIAIKDYLVDNKSNTNITIRVNVHKENYKDIIPLYNFLNKKSLLDVFSFYLAPVHAWGNDAHETGISMQKFSELELEIFKRMIADKHTAEMLPERNYEVCMAVNPTAKLIDPYGNVYSCTEIPLVNSYNHDEYIIEKLGNGNTKTKISRPFGDWYQKILDKTSRSPCYDCRILPVCGGACPKNWLEDHPSCPSIKFNIEERLKLAFRNIEKV